MLCSHCDDVDTTGRFIGQRLSRLWGQPVVADNRPGAGGSIAAETVAGAAPDAIGNYPDEFEDVYTSEIARWAKVVKAVGLQPR
jgi:tripartite-type tricarboxylate transporter receptor subunit TctC